MRSRGIKMLVSALLVLAFLFAPATEAIHTVYAMATVFLPTGLTRLDDQAFAGSYKVSGLITLPGKLTDLGRNVFSGTQLFGLVVPSSVKGVPPQGLKNAAYIRLNSASTQAEAGAFEGVAYVFGQSSSVLRAIAEGDGAEYVPLHQLAKESGFYFKKENGEATLLCAIDNESLRGSVKIPAALSDGTPVTALSAHAMMRCGGITQLEVPLGIREEAGCYDGCPQAVVNYYSDGSVFYVTSLRANQETVHPGTEVTWIARTNSTGTVEYYFEVAKQEEKALRLISRSEGFRSSAVYEDSNRYAAVLDEPGVYVATVICRNEDGVECTASSSRVRVLSPELAIASVSADATALQEGDTLHWQVETTGGNGTILFTYTLLCNNEPVEILSDCEENSFTLENAAAGEYALMVQAKDERIQLPNRRSETVTVYTAAQARPEAPVLSGNAFALTEENAPTQEAVNLALSWESVPYASQYGVTVDLHDGSAWNEVHHAAISGSKNGYTISAAVFSEITGETLCRIGVYSVNLSAGETRYYYVKLTPHVVDTSLTINGVTRLYWHEGYYAAATKSFTIESELPVTVTAEDGGDWYTYSVNDQILTVSMEENLLNASVADSLTISNGISKALLFISHFYFREAPILAIPANTTASAPGHLSMDRIGIYFRNNGCTFDVAFQQQAGDEWKTAYLIEDAEENLIFSARETGLSAGVLYRLKLTGYRYSLEDSVHQDALVSYGYLIFDETEDHVSFSGSASHTLYFEDHESTSVTIAVSGDIPTVSCDASWLSCYLSEDQTELHVKPTENTTAESRTAHVTVTCGSASAVLTVIQASFQPRLYQPVSLSRTESSPTKIYKNAKLENTVFKGEHDSIALYGYANGDYTNKIKSTTSSALYVEHSLISTNTTYRLTQVRGSTSFHYYVTFASSTAYLTLNDEEYYTFTLDPSGGSKTITLTSSASWTAEPQVSWLSVSAKSGSSTSGKSITVTAQPNTTGEYRAGTVLFKRGSYQQATALVFQYPITDSLALSWGLNEPYDTLGGDYTKARLYIDTPGAWQATTAESWMSFNSAGTAKSKSGNGFDYFYVYVTELPAGSSPRTGTVTVTAGTVTRSITLTQLPRLGASILSPAFSADDDNPSVFEQGDLTVTWQGDPNATYYHLSLEAEVYNGDHPTIHHSIPEDGSNTYSFTFPQDSMMPDSGYTCTLALQPIDKAGYGISEERYFTVVSGEGVFIEGKKTKNFSNANDLGDENSYTITSTGIWTAAPNEDWITVDKLSGGNGDSLKVIVAKNYGEKRKGTVTLTCGDKSAVIYVEQCAWIPDKPVLKDCILSTDMANPAIIDHNTTSLTVNWAMEYQVGYYQLLLYEVHTTSEKQHHYSLFNDNTLIASGKNLEPSDEGYTFENLSLTPGALYLLDFYRNMPGSDRRTGKTHYYFMASTEGTPYVYIYDTSTSETDEFESGEYGDSYKIVSNGTWRAESDSDWLMVGDEKYRQHELTEEGATPYDYNTYTAMDDRLVISALANTTNKTRTGHVTITIPGGNSCTIECVQLRGCTAATLQSPALTNDRKNPVWLPYGDVTLRWNASPDGAGKYTVTIKEKLPDENRFYEIYEKTTTNTSLTLPVSELTANADYNILLETWVDSEYTVCNAYYFHTGYENALTVTASVDWTDTKVDISAQASGGSGSGYQYAFALLRNGETVDECMYGYDGRYGFNFSGAGAYQIKVHVIDSEGQKQSFIVSQHTVGESAVEKYISVSPASWAVPAEGGEITLAVSANGAWNVSSAPAWLSADADDENGKAYVTAMANPGQTARTGVVIFTCGNAAASLAVTQSAPEAAGDDSSISLTESSWVITTDNASSRTLKITASGPWAVMESPAWITLSKVSGEGEETITLYAQPNTGNAREGKITFACGSASASFTIQQMGKDTLPVVTNFTMSEQEISTGIPLSFTVTAQDADSVILVVDGNRHETHALVNGSITFTRAFSSDGEREIRFLPLRGSVEGLLSAPQTLNVTSQGDLAPAVIYESAPVIIGNDAVVRWGKVANAENYAVFLSWNKNQLWKTTLPASETSCTIPSSVLSFTDAYTCVVMATATGYKQSESSIFVDVVAPVVNFSIASPVGGEEHVPSDTIDIQIDNPSGYHIAVKITDAEGNVTYLPENSGTVNDTFIRGKLLYAPSATGNVTVQAMAFPTEKRTADGNAWYDTNRNITFTIADDSPLAKMIYMGGSSSRSSMLVSELNKLEVKTNQYVTGVRVYLDGTLIETITNYTVSGSDRMFACDLPTATEGLHRYMTEVYTADGRTHQRTYTLYVASDAGDNSTVLSVLFPKTKEVLFRTTPAVSADKAETLPLSAQLEGLGLYEDATLGRLVYVRYGTRRGFVPIADLRTTQVMDYSGAVITFTNPTSEVAGFMFDDQPFTVTWDCSMELPDGARFSVEKRAAGDTDWATISHVEKSAQSMPKANGNSITLSKENLGTGLWELSICIWNNGHLYARTILPSLIRIFDDAEDYLNYLMNNSANADTYTELMDVAMKRLKQIDYMHANFVHSYYDPYTGRMVQPFELEEILNNAVRELFCSIFGETATIPDDTASQIAVLSGLLESLAPKAENVLISKVYNTLTTVIKSINLPVAFVDDLLEALDELKKTGAALTALGKAMDKVPADLLKGLTQGVAVADLIVDLTDAIILAVRYSLIDDQKLLEIANGFSLSSNPKMQEIASLLVHMRSDSYVVAYSFAIFSLDLNTFIKSTALEVIAPLIAIITGPYGVIAYAVVCTTSGLANALFDLSDIQEAASTLKWRITAAETYSHTFAAAMELFHDNPVLYYDEMVKTSDAFLRLIDAEYQALAELMDELGKDAAEEVGGYFTDWSGTADEAITTCKGMATQARMNLFYAMLDLYTEVLQYAGVEYISLLE